MRWLVKEEPTNYSFDQFLADRTTVWSGVRNPVAQRNLRAMKKGDRVFYYHTGKEKAVVGTAKVTAEAAPDPADPAGKLVVVELGRRSQAAAPGHARRGQGQRPLRGFRTGPDPAPLGHAGDRGAVGRD